MILWDTSALLSGLVEGEPGHARALNLLEGSERNGGSLLLRPELAGALLRRGRHATLDAFSSEWRRFSLLNLDEGQAALTERLIRRHRLKGFDAVHVAAALTLLQSIKRPRPTFVTADRAQAAAARAEGLRVIEL